MSYINIFSIKNSKWDEIVSSFSNYDVYWLSGYVKAFEINGDGQASLLYYSSERLRAIYVFMKRDISKSNIFSNDLKKNTYYDLISPYGYGGFLFDGEITDVNLKDFNTSYISFMKHENIVSNFVRYHPMIKNSLEMGKISNVINLGNTISMDLSSKEIIWKNIIPKNRNVIRKAEKNGVVIKHSKDMSLFDPFMKIYNATMDYDKAEDYYYFDQSFYKSIHEDLHDNYEMFYAEYEGKIIAMSLIIFANNKMHYHLSASIYEYRRLAPTNLLLYKAACWGSSQGVKTFHLGGGVGSGEDSLYKFKKAFNRNSNEQFSIGKEVYNKEVYDFLIKIRLEKDKNFNKESTFFPLYRENL
ncbi:MAG: GNAT family N-acetyltransferase [Bacteroidales bacterium]